MDFIDRKHELSALDAFHKRKQAGMLLLYGRRRVGKTLLLDHWVATRKISNAIFWTASTYSLPVQLRQLSQTVIQHSPKLSSVLGENYSFPTWEAVFEFLAQLAGESSEPLVIILDEFTNVIKNEKAITSELQKAWDHTLSKVANLRLILTGSLVAIMEQEVVSAQSPLYGRATAHVHLRPLPFGTLRQIFPDWTTEERVAAYAVCGGIPAYLGLLREGRNFVEGLRDHCLTGGSIMLTDSLLLLGEQLRDANTYQSILAAIASGSHTWGEIAKMAGVTETGLGSYLGTLQNLEYINEQRPVLSEVRGRKTRYFLSDHFLRFYYRFIVPHTTTIMRGRTHLMIDKLRADLRSFIGLYVFEDICRDWTALKADEGQLGFKPTEIGSYWIANKGEGFQLDVVAANRSAKRLFIGECKWGEGDIKNFVLTDLLTRAQKMPQVAHGWQADYALFAREGFTEATQATAKALKIQLVTATQVEDDLVTEVKR